MVFFQAALLLGYLYAHVLSSKLSVRTQRIVHVVLLVVAFMVLPMTTHSTWFEAVRNRAAGATEAGGLVLFALFGLVGLPFFAISANSSLLQSWFSKTSDPSAKGPYFLYAAGNVGSMIALLAYPIVLEPLFGISEQAGLWKIGFGVLVLFIGLASALSIPKSQATSEPLENRASGDLAPTTWAQRRLWIVLSAVPSSLLLGVTTYLTSNIAPIPLLWIIPLAFYLLTFILVFARQPKTPDVLLGRILSVLAVPLAVVIVLGSAQPILQLGTLHVAGFFIAAWMCHSRLAKAKPDPTHLTEFFFWVALGGVIGGAFNALLAPVTFNSLLEYPLAIAAACMLRPTSKTGFEKSDWIVPAAVLALTVGIALFLPHVPMLAKPGWQRTLFGIGLPVLLAFFGVDRPLRFGLSLAAVFVVQSVVHVASAGSVIAEERSFFGVHRVVVSDHGRLHELDHGNTIHGIQDLKQRDMPLTYYHPSGPIGQVMLKMPPQRAAFVGLGVGSLAAYGQPGQHFTYYEIDPIVDKIAKDPRYFTFLKDSSAKVDVVLGDARLTLAQSNEKFNLIVLDAFSSDAIPVHLLTTEAIKMYLSKLADHGVLAFHISNHYLDLAPVLLANARELNLARLYQSDGATQDEEADGKRQSQWFLLARKTVDFTPLLDTRDFDEPEDIRVRPWTDDYCNVIGAFKAREE